MKNELVSLVELAWPIVLGLFLLALGVLVSGGGSGLIVDVPVLDVIRLSVPVSPSSIRYLLIAVAFLCFAYPGIRDYTAYFPHLLQLDVSFDDRGLRDCLETVFTSAELDKLGIERNWEEKKKQYLCALNGKLFDILGLTFHFKSAPGLVHSRGTVSLEFERSEGFQTYSIVKADGTLTHEQVQQGDTPLVLVSQFHLNELGCTIKARLRDIYWHWKVIISPPIDQFYLQGKARYDHLLIAVTRVQLFPSILIGPTIYATGGADGAALVPVAYGKYRIPK